MRATSQFRDGLELPEVQFQATSLRVKQEFNSQRTVFEWGRRFSTNYSMSHSTMPCWVGKAQRTSPSAMFGCWIIESVDCLAIFTEQGTHYFAGICRWHWATGKRPPFVVR